MSIVEHVLVSTEIQAIDCLGRTIRLDQPAMRIVSLVPSETLSVIELANIDRLVGRTDFCEDVDQVPSIGGTKGFDVDAVLSLEPDLVLANKEENGEPRVRELIERGLNVHVSFPCSIQQSTDYLRSLAMLLGVSSSSPMLRFAELAGTPVELPEGSSPLKVFVPIWKEPWMTFDGRVFASDVLEVSGAHNVFSDRPRRYPLAADLGKRRAWDAAKVGDRDTRYPRIELAEVVERAPDVVLLPDEPYRFSDEDRKPFEELLPEAQVHLIPGKDLFWYGTQTVRSLDRMRALIIHLSE